MRMVDMCQPNSKTHVIGSFVKERGEVVGCDLLWNVAVCPRDNGTDENRPSPSLPVYGLQTDARGRGLRGANSMGNILPIHYKEY